MGGKGKRLTITSGRIVDLVGCFARTFFGVKELGGSPSPREPHFKNGIPAYSYIPPRQCTISSSQQVYGIPSISRSHDFGNHLHLQQLSKWFNPWNVVLPCWAILLPAQHDVLALRHPLSAPTDSINKLQAIYVNACRGCFGNDGEVILFSGSAVHLPLTFQV